MSHTPPRRPSKRNQPLLIPRQLVIDKRKYDNTLWGSYAVFVLAQTAERHSFWQPRGTYINRNHGWTMRHDHLQFFYPGRWYAISANYDDRGQLSHCYCDVILPWVPPQPQETATRFVDLELDLHVMPTGAYRIYDEDEFAAAIVTMQYPDAIRLGAIAALQDLMAAAIAWTEPFAGVPRSLPRHDYHRMDPASVIWRESLAALGLG
jgi:protein associated with RNAse G/E